METRSKKRSRGAQDAGKTPTNAQKNSNEPDLDGMATPVTTKKFTADSNMSSVIPLEQAQAFRLTTRPFHRKSKLPEPESSPNNVPFTPMSTAHKMDIDKKTHTPKNALCTPPSRVSQNSLNDGFVTPKCETEENEGGNVGGGIGKIEPARRLWSVGDGAKVPKLDAKENARRAEGLDEDKEKCALIDDFNNELSDAKLAKNLEKALDVWKQIQKKNATPNALTLELMMRTLCRCRYMEYENALEIFNAMCQLGGFTPSATAKIDLETLGRAYCMVARAQ